MAREFLLRYERGRLRRRFDLDERAEPTWDSELHVKPGEQAVTIEWNARGKPTPQMARFGFKMREGVLPMINHRCESINPAAPTRAFLEGRCIVPVDVFFVLAAAGSGVGAGEEPRMISYGSRDDRILLLAAMLRPEAGGLSMTLLTAPARDVVRAGNGRMPAIIGEDDLDAWLDDTTPTASALAMLAASHDALLVERAF